MNMAFSAPRRLHSPAILAVSLSIFAMLLCVASATAQTNQAAHYMIGVIEVGGSGIKATVYDMSPKQALALTTEAAAVQGFRYTAFKKALVQDYQPFDTKLSALTQWPKAIDAIAGFKKAMQQDHAVPSSRIYIVASSSVKEIKAFAIFQARVLKATGIALDAVTAEAECKLTFNWLVPGSRAYQALVIDVGSGNTKACYLEPGADSDRWRSFELLPFGTKTFESEVRDLMHVRKELSFPDASLRQRIALIDRRIETQSSGNAGLRTRRRLYLSGGAAWAVATFTHPSEVKVDWVKLSVPADFRSVREIAAQGRLPEPNTSAIRNPELRSKADKEIATIGDVFTADQIVTGTDILTAIVEDLHAQTEKDVVFFPRPAKDAWRSRYLVEKLVQLAMKNDFSAP